MEIFEILRYLGALLLVLALLGLAGLAARRFGVPGVTASAATKRLAVVETLMIGPRHRLYLLRRDDVEHLIFSGPEGTSVVETGIPSRQTSSVEHAATTYAKPSTTPTAENAS
jgi:flagellar protein FliO/FliZ